MPEVNPVLLFTCRLGRVGTPYMITGSVAVIVYGEPRLTHDIDIVIALTSAQATQLMGAFDPSEFYVPPLEVIEIESLRDQRGHFNIIHHETGFKADFYPSGRDALHTWGLGRARELSFEGETIRVAPPEYVIVRKLEFFREGRSEKHLRDIRSMVSASSEDIDHDVLRGFMEERGLTSLWNEALANP